MDKKKILIIDDEADFCLLLKSYFSAKEYEVYYSYSLNNGMKLLDEVNPDILFLDNNLPDGLGWQKAYHIAQTHPAVQLNLVSTFDYEIPSLKKASYKIWEKPLKLKELNKYLTTDLATKEKGIE